MNIKTRNTLCYEAWMAKKPEFAGKVIRSKKATTDDGFKLVKLVREQGVDAADKYLGEIDLQSRPETTSWRFTDASNLPIPKNPN